MRFCEAEDVVAVAWLLRAEIAELWPYLSSWLRPGCDRGRSCSYHRAYHLSEAFGALFRSCGRWPHAPYALGDEFQHNGSCSDLATIARQTDLFIPDGAELRPEDTHPLEHPIDRELFYEDWHGQADDEYPLEG
jgi:hypothetical protein